MSSIAIDNIDDRLLEKIKQLAIQAGASFRVFPTEVPLATEVPTLPPFNQAIADMPRGEDNEDIFVRDYQQEYSHREIDWND